MLLDGNSLRTLIGLVIPHILKFSFLLEVNPCSVTSTDVNGLAPIAFEQKSLICRKLFLDCRVLQNI